MTWADGPSRRRKRGRPRGLIDLERLDDNLGHFGRRGSLPQPGDELLDRLLFATGHYFDTAIRKITRETYDARRPGTLLGRAAIVDTLHSAANDAAPAGRVCHASGSHHSPMVTV